jgi:NADP-dependent 3-hydroxy acid dehydrogenase YdfG
LPTDESSSGVGQLSPPKQPEFNIIPTGPITEQTAKSFAATFDTNVLGVLLSMKHAVLAMQGQDSGSIVNISSTYGHKGAAFASVYVAAKHARGPLNKLAL